MWCALKGCVSDGITGCCVCCVHLKDVCQMASLDVVHLKDVCQMASLDVVHLKDVCQMAWLDVVCTTLTQ